jgi:LETM1-like protein
MLSVGRGTIAKALYPSHLNKQNVSIPTCSGVLANNVLLNVVPVPRKGRMTALQCQLSTISAVETQRFVHKKRDTYNRVGHMNLESNGFGAFTNLVLRNVSTIVTSTDQSPLMYETNLNRSGYLIGLESRRSRLSNGCVDMHQRFNKRRLNSFPSNNLQVSFFSSVPSLKPKDEKEPATSSAVVANPLNTTSKFTTTTNTPLPSRKLGKTAVPTPPSAPPSDTNPLQSFKDATPKSVIRKGVDLIVSASKVVVTHLSIRDTVKHEIHHYWVGTKLLWADIVTARKLLNKTLEGSALTRRERKQLLRTVSDLFRLIPFSMFVIVPFMEFALPFALRIFPNMLPSTYQDSLKAEENMKRELKSRIAMAQFFQE